MHLWGLCGPTGQHLHQWHLPVLCRMPWSILARLPPDSVPSLTCSVRERCLEEQKRRRQRATKKISTFIGTFLVCFAPYVITR